MEDNLICWIDGLKGFPEAIGNGFPKAEVQLCIVQQIRNSLKYIARKNAKGFVKDLKMIYQTDTLELAENAFFVPEEKCGAKYPAVIKSWQQNWEI